MNIIREHFNWRHQLLILVLTVGVTVGGFFMLDIVETENENIVSASSHCGTTIFTTGPGLHGFMCADGSNLGAQRVEGNDTSSCGSPNRGFMVFDTSTILDTNIIQSVQLRAFKFSTNNGDLYQITDPFTFPLSVDEYDNNEIFIQATYGGDNVENIIAVPNGSVDKTWYSTYSLRSASGYVRYATQAAGDPGEFFPPELHVTHCSAIAPTVNTLVQQNVTTNSARIRGEANPNGLAATGWLRYSTVSPGACNDSFGTRAPDSGGTALGSGSGLVTYHRDIVSLASGTTYYYCAIASNSSGTSLGNVRSFTTVALPTPIVTTNIASNISGTGAQLNGSANPNSLATTGWFRYSTINPGACNDVFGTRVPVAGGTALGSGAAPIGYSNTLATLTTGTTYYFCAIASNASGKGFGSVVSFTTPSYTVSGFVYEDINGNGVKDIGESGAIFSGSTIKIDYQAGGNVATTTTDGSGFYVFTGLSSGNYVLILSPVPVGYNANNNNIPFSL